ncbi:MAG: hypothetical protein ACR2KJ_07240 [Jatrophihabitans sp.]
MAFTDSQPSGDETAEPNDALPIPPNDDEPVDQPVADPDAVAQQDEDQPATSDDPELIPGVGLADSETDQPD